ncbi:hypothetical protein B0T22DRAFT_484618 [Podospora appendiculata]|uniref:K Homology domain-containing protein n=1 Tax=Podospora appendiculata TaxID=314037 RepID=A0AAE0X1L7_9PEZI|nr:hypothetical protein B0T22DRAFT_484618 [Podospora appendiculata]
MADTTSSEPSAASQLLQQHNAAHAHHVTIEDAEDPDLPLHKPVATTAVEAPPSDSKPSWAEPMTAKAAGKQKAQESKVLDTASHELFPALGGPKPKANAGVAPIWGSAKSVNGKTNGTPTANGSSTPASGVTTPTGPALQGPPSLSIPGRNVETMLMDSNHVLPRNQLKRPLPDILKDLNKKSRVNITMSTMGNGGYKFEANGARDVAQQALKDLAHQIGTKQTLKVPIPQSAKAHIIGKGGSTIKSIQEKSGARIQLPKVDESQPLDDDDEDMIDVLVEGNALSAVTARDLILKIAGDRASNVNSRMKGIPAAFYPFIAGSKNNNVQKLEELNGVQIRVPPHQAWSSQHPNKPARGERPVFAPSPADNPIELAGDRASVQAARGEIERIAEELRRQLTIEQLAIQRGRHQFIIGERGIPTDDFFEDTGCIIILPNDEDDDMVTIVGPPEQVQAGMEKAMDLAMGMQCSNIDISRFHRQAPGGAAAHARNVTRYLRERKEFERLEKLYNVHFNTPSSDDGGALPWELYSRDGRNAIRAQSEIKGLVDNHPPARMASVPVDPFFHNYIRNEVSPRVREEYSVRLVVPDASDIDEPVLLVYEGAATGDAYEVPRDQPSQGDISDMAKFLQGAQKHIEDLVNQQESITSEDLEVPRMFQDKLRKFIKKEQQENRSAIQIPVRVFGNGTTVTFKGLSSDVEAIAAKCRAFVEQEKEDEKERGFTLEFEFAQKFANHLIGKGGSNIRELREKFDVDIQVQDGKVELKGPKAKAEAAKTHILALGRQLQDEVSHTLKIEPQFHRELIGAQGSQINRLQTRYKVHIFFPRTAKSNKDDESATEGASDAGKPRRQQAADEVIVRGPKKGADEAREELLLLVQYLRDNAFTATVSVQQKQVPSLIGTGGAALDQLRQSTGARIDIPHGRESVSEDGMVEIQIKGGKSQVAAAKKLLEEKKAIFDDTVVKNIEVDKKYHKTLIGANGSNLRDIVLKAGGSDDRRELSRTIQFPKQDTDGNVIKVEGRTDIVDKIIAQIEAFVLERSSQVTEVVEVPQEKHRVLIGRGGDVKRGLESQFKVSIDIPRQNSGQTGVKIVGQSADVEKAKAHIQSLVKEQQGQAVQVPRALHHAVSNNGQFFRRLRGDHHVTVDHDGHSLPAKPVAPAPTNGAAALPLITDDEDANADVHSWNLVELTSTEEGEIPWVLRGSPENIEKAKKAIETALEQAKKQTTAGYLVLPDPKTHRHIIGQGGSKVNSIRKQSGCQITVPRDSTKGEAIEIIGTAEGVEKARELILAAVRDGANNRDHRSPRDE